MALLGLSLALLLTAFSPLWQSKVYAAIGDNVTQSIANNPSLTQCKAVFDGQTFSVGALPNKWAQLMYTRCEELYGSGGTKDCTFSLGSGGNKVSCKSAVGSASTQINEQLTKPLIVQVCGKNGKEISVPPDAPQELTAYNQCGGAIDKIYQTCGGSITNAPTYANSPDTIAACIGSKLATVPHATNTRLTNREIAQAIKEGSASALTLQNTVDSTAREDECVLKGSTWDPASNSCTNKAADGDKTTCAVDGIGWIVCPVMTFLGGVMDAIQSFLADHFLSTNPELVKADPSNGTFQAWGIFRNYANLAFIGVFLFIIYSQMTGAGLSNYGLKRMLPRLIVAAILVNLSFYICMIAVDLSNILGYGVKSIFDGVTTAAAGTSGSTPSWATAIAGVLITGLGVALALAAGIILPALIAALMIVLILVAREALIVLLIVISPLAFVAYLLPNTEKFFQKWMSAFWKLLMVFPIVAAVFGVSTMTSRILYNTGQTELQIIALGVTVIPFFVVPTLLKGATTAIGAVGSRMQGWGNKATGRTGARAKERWGNSLPGRYGKYRSAESAKRSALIRSGQFEGEYKKYDPRRLRNLQNAAYGKFNTSSVSGKFGDTTAASGVGIADKQEEEELSDRMKLLKRQAPVGEELDHAESEFHKAAKSGDIAGMKAAMRVMGSSGNPGLQKLHSAVAAAESDGTIGEGTAHRSAVKREIQGLNLKSRDNSLDSWSYGKDDKSDNSLNGVVNSGSNASALSTAELMGQDYLHLHKLASDGKISVAQAQSVLADPNQAGIPQNKRELMEDIVTSQTGKATIALSAADASNQKAIYG